MLPAGRLDGATVDATASLAIAQRAVDQPGLLLDGFSSLSQFAVTQGGQQVASEDDTLPASFGQALIEEEVHAA